MRSTKKRRQCLWTRQMSRARRISAWLTTWRSSWTDTSNPLSPTAFLNACSGSCRSGWVRRSTLNATRSNGSWDKSSRRNILSTQGSTIKKLELIKTSQFPPKMGNTVQYYCILKYNLTDFENVGTSVHIKIWSDSTGKCFWFGASIYYWRKTNVCKWR